MGTTTHYVVRNAEGEHLAGWWCGSERRFVFDTPRHEEDEEFASRTEAERLAAEHGGKVCRVTTVEEDVDLRWETEPHWDDCGDEWLLREAKLVLGRVEPSHDGRWCWWLNNHSTMHTAQACATLDEAKAAAEQAVKGTWS